MSVLVSCHVLFLKKPQILASPHFRRHVAFLPLTKAREPSSPFAQNTSPSVVTYFSPFSDGSSTAATGSSRDSPRDRLTVGGSVLKKDTSISCSGHRSDK